MATSDSLGKGGNGLVRCAAVAWLRLGPTEFGGGGGGRRRDELIRFEVPLQSRLFGPGCTLTPH